MPLRNASGVGYSFAMTVTDMSPPSNWSSVSSSGAHILELWDCTRTAVGQWVADFPVKAEGIGYTSDAPAVSFADGIDLRGASFQSTGEHFIRIRNREYHSNRSSTDRPRNRAGEVRRFLA